RHAQFITTLAIISSSLEKFATEIRGLQKTETREVEEPFGASQTGSSAMPHKRNPELCERICGLARLVRSYALTSMENIALWHERDISHSSTERIILPDSYLIRHFLESLATEARLNLHARVVYGVNDHHKAEALFKALGRALDTATRIDERISGELPSTKGLL
ncbi:unnamed protein product, partial [marine sediment metagenome]